MYVVMKKLLAIVLLFVCVMCVRADVVSYLRFEEGSGYGAWDETGLMNGEVLNFSDVSPGGGDAGPQGWSVSVPSPLVPLTGAQNTGSIRYAGGSAFIDLSNFNDLSLGTEFTIELYIQPENPDLFNGMFLFTPVSSLAYNLQESSGDLFLRGFFQGQLNAQPAPLLQEDQWQHFALVKEPGEYTLYIDGELQYNGLLPAGTDGPYFFPGTGTTGDRTFGDGFRGWLDEFRISDEALTPDQFLNYQIPEPSTILLLLIGGIALFSRRRSLRNRRRF